MKQIDGIARYLSQLDSADREGPTVPGFALRSARAGGFRMSRSGKDGVLPHCRREFTFGDDPLMLFCNALNAVTRTF